MTNRERANALWDELSTQTAWLDEDVAEIIKALNEAEERGRALPERNQ